VIDETISGHPEGEALPASNEIKVAIHLDPKPLVYAIGELKADAARVIDAVERWYAAHFHAAAVAGVAPLSADDKAALIQHVADAVAPPATQE
jgi:hypothetical protein